LINEKHIFTGRINADDADHIVPQNDLRYAENVHAVHSNDGGIAAVKNVPSNQLVEFTKSGSNCTVVGAYEDEENERIFYFVTSDSAAADEILCYDRREGVTRRVLADDIFGVADGVAIGLGFSTDYLITGIGMVGDYLFWTDNNDEPRYVNVERGMRYYDNTYTSPDGSTPEAYTLPLYYYDLTLIRPQPRFPLLFDKVLSTDEVSVPDQATNQIDGYAFQFTYRFIYKNNAYSTLAPYSYLAEYNNPDDSNEYDTIRPYVPKQQTIGQEVLKVQFLYRTPETNSWYVYREFDKSVTADLTAINNHNGAGNSLTALFFNTYTGTLIPEADAVKPFDAVPVASKALEVARNRIFLANNTEGYDPFTVSMTAEEVTQEAGSVLQGDYVWVRSACSDVNFEDVLLVKIQGSGDTNIDGFYEVSTAYDYDTDWNNELLPSIQILSPDQRVLPFSIGPDSDLFDLYSPCGAGAWDPLYSFTDFAYTGGQVSVLGLTDEAGIGEGLRIFKSNSRYRVGVVFFDFAGRNAGVSTTEDCLVNTSLRTHSDLTFTTGIKWSLTDIPGNIPIWATHYAVVRTKCLSTSFFFQSPANQPKYVTQSADGTFTYSNAPLTTDYAIAIPIGQLLNLGFGYTLSTDDEVRIFPNDGSDPSVHKVLNINGEYLFVTPQNLGNLSSTKYNDVIFELITPYRESSDELYYEVGNTYKINSAGTSTRNFSNPYGVLRGDSFVKERIIGGLSGLLEVMSPDDKQWQDWHTDIGRLNLVLRDSGRETRTTAIRWSDQFVAGSKVNGVHSFNAVDEFVLDEESGSIQKLVLTSKAQAEGTVMLSIGTVNTFSLYLGETQVIDNAEQTLLATSGNTVGTTRELRGGHGTLHSESVVEHDGSVYWYDQVSSAVVRYNLNGLTPVSDYKMRSFFKRLATETNSLQVIGGFDRYRSEYLLTPIGLSTVTGIEYLNDYDGETLKTGNIASYAGISFGFEVDANVSYTLVVNVDADGIFVVYVDGVQYSSTEVVAGVDEEIVINSSRGGQLSYYYLPTDMGGRGSYTLLGSRISCHQAWQGRARTLAFRDIQGIEGWSSFYSYIPEWFGSIGDLLITFKNGDLYTHDANTFNNFYGTAYNTILSFVVNGNPSTVKIPLAISAECNNEPSWTHFRVEYPNIQSSDLEDEWEVKEGNFYATLLLDRLSPNSTGTYEQKLFKADSDRLRGRFIEVCMEWNETAEEIFVTFVTVGYIPSTGHLII